MQLTKHERKALFLALVVTGLMLSLSTLASEDYALAFLGGLLMAFGANGLVATRRTNR